MARLSRGVALPEAQRPRVAESVTQRAFDALATPLIAVVKFLQPFAKPEGWKDLDFYGDWTANANGTGTVQYKKSPLGEVMLRGWAQSAAGNQSVVGVLPTGYRPPQRLRVPASWYTGAAYALIQLDVDVDGRVLVASPAMPGAAIDIFLDHVRFEVT